MMATRTQVVLSCDVCGNAKDVRTRAFGLDGKAYEIDLCPQDSKGLSNFAVGYVSKARKIAARHSLRRGGRRPRPPAEEAGIIDGGRTPDIKVPARGRVTGSAQREAEAGRSEQQAAKARAGKAKATCSTDEARTRRSRPRKAGATSRRVAGATRAVKEKGIYVYGILPADIEVAAEMPGVGEHPGQLRAVRSNGLAALISEVNLSGRRLGSRDDRRIHREILDATATEVPVFPLRFGTVMPSEDAVAKDVLAAHHGEFAAALEQLEGRAEFVVKGEYIEEAVLREVLSEDKQAAWLQGQIRGKDPGRVRDARTELDEIINRALTARRKRDTRTLEHVMEGICVASVVREPSHLLGAVSVAFLVAVDRESEVEQAIGDLARAWEGRIEVRLLGPIAAYDFAETAKPDS